MPNESSPHSVLVISPFGARRLSYADFEEAMFNAFVVVALGGAATVYRDSDWESVWSSAPIPRNQFRASKAA